MLLISSSTLAQLQRQTQLVHLAPRLFHQQLATPAQACTDAAPELRPMNPQKT